MRPPAAKRPRLTTDTSIRVLQDTAIELIDNHCVRVPGNRYRDVQALRLELYFTVTAMLKQAVCPHMRKLHRAITALPWQIQQRLLYAVNVDIQNHVSPLAAAAAPWVGRENEFDPVAVLTGSAASSGDALPETETQSPGTTSLEASGSPAPQEDEYRFHDDETMGRSLSLKGVPNALVRQYMRLARAFSLGPMPPSPVPAALTYRPGGSYLWSESRREIVPAFCRYTGAGPVRSLRGGDAQALRAWQAAGNAVGGSAPHDAMRLASDAFLHWWSAREHLRARISEWTVEVPTWPVAEGGSWLRGRMTDLPGARSPQDDDCSGWHGTSLHYLERIAARGLEGGWNKETDDKGTWGIAYFAEAEAHAAVEYALYTALEQASGFVFAPILQLRAPRADPGGRVQCMSQRWECVDMRLTYPDVCEVTDVWINVRHVLEVHAGYLVARISAEGCFSQWLEADARMTRRELVSRAIARWKHGARASAHEM